MKILVIQLRQLGDILLTTPCLRALKQEFPKARITFLSHAMGRLILDDCPFLDEHFFYDDTWSKMRELRLARTLRARGFDLVFDFMNNPRSAFYTLMAKGSRRYAFTSARRLAYTDTVPRPSGIYIVEEKFELLRHAGLNPTDRRLVLPWMENHTKPLLHLQGTDSAFRDASLRVVLSPTHRREMRRWPAEKYAEIADRLARDGAYVSWLYGPGEEEFVENAMALCREKTHKAPKTGFREMAAYIANMDLFIGNSNGPSHVAVAVDTPSLQIHGHTDMHAWCPLTERHQAVQADMDADGLKRLAVDAVWERVLAMRPVTQANAEARKVDGLKVHWKR